jgi:S1-C subfamily serine protease
MSDQENEYVGPPAPTESSRAKGRRPARLATVGVAALLVLSVVAGVTIARALRTGSHSSASLQGKRAPIATAVSAALVDISVSFDYDGSSGAATGIVVSPEGEVLTNNHVIDGATRISATDVGNGRTYTATVVGYAPSVDIAVLQLQGASGLATAKLGDSSNVAIGEAVRGIGNARGAGGTPAIARGTIASLDQSLAATDGSGVATELLSGLIEVNADIQPGDSGGPLIDDRGRVIAVNTAGSSPGLGSPRTYAVPINQALSTARRIESGNGSATVHIGPSGFLGVRVSVANSAGGPGSGLPRSAGLRVGDVVGGAAAAKAGLGPGDLITALDGRRVRSAAGLRAIMLSHHPHDVVRISWTDNAGHRRISSVELGSGPPT